MLLPTFVAGLAKVVTDGAAVKHLTQEFTSFQERFSQLGVLDWAFEQARKDARRSLECMHIFNQVHHIRSEDTLRTYEDYWTLLWFTDSFIPLAKYVFSYPLSSHSGVYDPIMERVQFRELSPPPSWVSPESPFLSLLFPKALSVSDMVHILRTRLREQVVDTELSSPGLPVMKPSPRALRLCFSLLRVKAMFPSMRITALQKNLEKHAKQLGSPPPLALPYRSRQVIQLVTRSLMSGVPSYNSLPEPKLSTSAGWVKMYDEDSRRFCTMRGTRAAQHERLALTGKELMSMQYDPSSNTTHATYWYPRQFDWREWDFDSRVSVVALQEPFKIRTITIADGPSTAAGSRIQKWLHSVMRQLPVFQLIGGRRMDELVGCEWLNAPLVGDEAFCSGDYSGATDNLSMEATKACLDTMFQCLPLDPELRRRLETGLTGSVLDYSATLQMFKGTVPDALLQSIRPPGDTVQKNGQLMGNILSFLVLCIVNLSAYLETCLYGAEIWPASYRPLTYRTESMLRHAIDTGGVVPLSVLGSLPVLVNGDDILFRCSPEFYDSWQRTIRAYGLELSVGKNYFSPYFYTVNSELRFPDGRRIREPFWGAFLPDFVRMRNELRHEIQMDVLQVDYRRVLPAVQQMLKESVRPDDWPIVNSLWLRNLQINDMVQCYSGLNYFLPISLGGLGLDDAGWGDYEITFAQRKLAWRLSLNADGAPNLVPGDDTLLSSEEDRSYRKTLRTKVWTVKDDEEVLKRGARTYIVDRERPVDFVSLDLVTLSHGMQNRPKGDEDGPVKERVRLNIYLRVAETEDSRVQGHLDRWIDYHTEGQRVSTTSVRSNVTRLLKWGMALSKRNASADSLPAEPPKRIRVMATSQTIRVPRA